MSECSLLLFTFYTGQISFILLDRNLFLINHRTIEFPVRGSVQGQVGRGIKQSDLVKSIYTHGREDDLVSDL